MIIRLWSTKLVPELVSDYDAFASSTSLEMFRSLDGCLGVVFLRSKERGFVFSFWRDSRSVDALRSSAPYDETVRRIAAAGLLAGEQTVDVVKLTGGFMTSAAADELVRSAGTLAAL